ncbi:MAG: hypothetical protein NDF52_05400 [archaeon YNP-WB-062]|nr:hypothetical protein [Candidatus Culexarchaeum yellowstonense]
MPITITTNTVITGTQKYDKIIVSGADLTINGIVKCLEIYILGSSVTVEGGALIVRDQYTAMMEETAETFSILTGILVAGMATVMIGKAIGEMFKEEKK